MQKTTLYIMCGLPFSGKSIFSKEVAEKTSIVRVSFDDVWYELTPKIPDLTYEMVIEYIEKIITDYFSKGISVIYDSTNLRSERRTSLLYLAEKEQVKGVVIYIPTTKEEMCARQAQSLIDKSHDVIDQENIDMALEHVEVPADCITLATEEDKKILMEKLVAEFPRG